MVHSHKLSSKNIMPFILGGKALFTLKNSKTGKRFTYQVTIPHETKPENASIYFVKLLTGADNTGSYAYIGYIRKVDNLYTFHYGSKSRCSKSALGVVAFEFVFNNLVRFGTNHADLEIWHEGQCCRCGRTLTVPESIETGIGPECARINSKHGQLKYETELA